MSLYSPKSSPINIINNTMDPPVEAVADSILETEDDVVIQDTADMPVPDVPGPSSTYFPPANPDPLEPPSPTLPNLATPLSDDEGEDEVIARLPVYISPALHPSLALFQYPLQHRSLRAPAWAGDRGKRITTRVKESVGRVEIEVPVDQGASVWRDERAKDLGYVPDVGTNGHRDEDKRKKAEGRWGDKMRLRSEGVPLGENYYCGLVHEGALHLHPISRVLQFRTALNYLDDFDAKNRGTRREEEEERKKSAVRRDLAAMPKALDDPSNDGSGSIKDFRNKMWHTAMKEDDDKWVQYGWHDGAEDTRVLESLSSLLLPEERRGMMELKSRALDYLDRAR